MAVQLNLKEKKRKFPTDIPYGTPFVVIDSNNEDAVVIFAENGAVWFEYDGCISWSDKDYVRNSAKFIRYLSEDESVTFTGKNR